MADNQQLSINELLPWSMSLPNGDPRVFGLPCRFPARPSILALCGDQVFDHHRFFGAMGATENFLP
jgi:hypothetical protein